MDNTKIDLTEMGYKGVGLDEIGEGWRQLVGSCKEIYELSACIKGGFL